MHRERKNGVLTMSSVSMDTQAKTVMLSTESNVSTIEITTNIVAKNRTRDIFLRTKRSTKNAAEGRKTPQRFFLVPVM